VSRRAVVAGIAVVALVAVLIGGWLVVGGSDDDGSAVDVRPRVTVSEPPTTVPTVATTDAPVVTTTTAPLPAGPPYAVGLGRLTLVDDTRPTAERGPTPAATSRTLPVAVRYPAVGTAGSEVDGAPAAAGAYPLVVFAHGFAIRADDYAPFLRDLAAQGFVVVAPDFPRSSLVFPGPPTQADIDEQARDVGFLVDAFATGSAPGPWQGHVAPGEAGVVGHSDGGNTVARAASNSCCMTPAIGAAVVLSGDAGTSGGTWGVAGSSPILFLQGTADAINPWSLTQRLYDDAASPKSLVAIEGGDHLEPYLEDPPRSAVVAVVAAFLRGQRIDDLANRDPLRLVSSS